MNEILADSVRLAERIPTPTDTLGIVMTGAMVLAGVLGALGLLAGLFGGFDA